MADKDDTYAPTTVEVDRARMQGLGVGQKDLDLQRDPGARSAEEANFTGEADVGSGDSDGRAGPSGKPDEAYDKREADEVSFSQPSGGAGG